MEDALEIWFAAQPWYILCICIAALIAGVVWAADKLVGEAVVLSERAGIPKAVIGATVVSMGTTAPEAAVSVLAALQGEAGLALGNAVGSIICDTGLILGIVCLISPPKIPRDIVNRQAWLQVLAGVLLVATSWPWSNMRNVFSEGGNLPQWAGVGFMLLLGAYMWTSVRWAKKSRDASPHDETHAGTGESNLYAICKLVASLVLVVLASHLLIPAVKEIAQRAHIPDGVIAATLVAFGTSLPELVTAVTAARRGHGDLAVGNIIGADILNVLFVAGTAAAVTPDGLDAGPSFFKFLFPAMLFVLVLFRVGTLRFPDRLPRVMGVFLLAAYAAALFLTLGH